MASNSKPFQCSQCSRSYDSQQALEQHVWDRHRPASAQTRPALAVVLPCDDCLRKFPNQAALEQHKRDAHIKSQVTNFPCSHCKRSFDAEEKLSQHVQASHQAAKGQSPPVSSPPTASVPCDECLRKFETPAALVQHKEQSHRKQAVQVTNFPCSHCKRSFDGEEKLSQHVQASHKAAKGQSPPVSSPPTASVPCDECLRKFETPAALVQHKEQSHRKQGVQVSNFPCSHCKRSFDAEEKLSQHVQASHQAAKGQSPPVSSPPTASVPCDECLRKFETPSALVQHKEQSHRKQGVQAVITNSKPFQCPHCKRSYDAKTNLDQHIQASHQPQRGQSTPVSSPSAKDVPCNDCSRKFSSSDALEQHKKQSHMKIENGQNQESRRPSTEGFTCGHCAITFASEVQLMQHQTSSGHLRPTSNPRKSCIENVIKDTKMAITGEDRKKSKERVKTVIDTLIKHVRSQDGGKIYIPDIHKAGSSAVGAKIGMADEFDTNIPIKVDIMDVKTQGSLAYIYKDKITHCTEGPSVKNMNVPRELCDNPSYSIPNGQAMVKVNPQTIPGYLTYNGDLIPHMVLQDFYKKLVVAMKETQLGSQGVHLSKEAHGPALTLTLKQPGQHDISVDLTISLAIGIPADKHGWPRPETFKAYSQDKIKEVTQAGTHLVPKGDETWSISFSKAEKALLGNIDAGNGCRKAVLKFLKRHFQICQSRSKDGLPGISSHIVKTQILWSSELHPGVEHWHESNLDQRVLDTMLELEKSLANRKMPYYFCPITDVLGNKDMGVLTGLASYLKEERIKLEAIPAKNTL